MAVELYPLHDPGRSDDIDEAIGEGSPFHETFGMYVQGVGPETAVLPEGWQRRLVTVKTPATSPAIGLCLEVHDLAISKYIAGRPKDLEFTRELARHGMTKQDVLQERLAATRVDHARRALALQRIRSHRREKV
jgi:hypothetical protein